VKLCFYYFKRLKQGESVHLSALGSTDTLVAQVLLLDGLLAGEDSRGAGKSHGAEVRAVTAASNDVSNRLGGVTTALADGGLVDTLGRGSNLSLGGGDLNTAGSSLDTNSL
jgi:hypothetical protein